MESHQIDFSKCPVGQVHASRIDNLQMQIEVLSDSIIATNNRLFSILVTIATGVGVTIILSLIKMF